MHPSKIMYIAQKIQIGIQTHIRNEYDRSEVKNIHSLWMYMVINRYLLKNLQNQVNQTI